MSILHSLFIAVVSLARCTSALAISELFCRVLLWGRDHRGPSRATVSKVTPKSKPVRDTVQRSRERRRCQDWCHLEVPRQCAATRCSQQRGRSLSGTLVLPATSCSRVPWFCVDSDSCAAGGLCREMPLPAGGVAAVGHKIAVCTVGIRLDRCLTTRPTVESNFAHNLATLRDAMAGNVVRGVRED